MPTTHHRTEITSAQIRVRDNDDQAVVYIWAHEGCKITIAWIPYQDRQKSIHAEVEVTPAELIHILATQPHVEVKRIEIER